MTITTIQNSVTLGTGSAVPLYPSIVDLQPTTTAYCLQAAVTFSSSDLSPSWPLVRFATAIDALPASVDTCLALSRSSGYLDLKPNANTRTTYTLSPVLSPKGQNLYTWIEDVTLPASATLTVKLIEYP